MKKYLHKALASAMVGMSVVTMTACSTSDVNSGITSESNQNIPMGRYMEETLEIPTDLDIITHYTRDKSGTIALYGHNKEGKTIAYTSQDGKNWEGKEVAWLAQLEAEKNYVASINLGQNGMTYVLYSNADMEHKLSKVKEDGTLEEVPFSHGIDAGMPSKVEILENGDILVGSYYTGVTRYSGVDGSRQTEYEGADGEFTVVGDKLALADTQRGGVVLFDLATGKEENMIAYDGMEWGSKLISDGEGNLYIINSSGVNRLANGGSIWENIIEAGMSSFGKPSLFISNVSVNEGEFNVLFHDQVEGYEMIKYTYNSDIPSRPTTEVNVYTLEDNMTIRQAAAEYQRQNPEVMIRLQVGIKPGEITTKSDAIRTLNTELLAGKGPDILILDGLPIESYVDKGVLLDMNEFIGTMIDDNTLLGNIMEAYKEDNKIYAVPTSFELPMMWGDADLLKEVDSVEELATWAKAHPDQQVMYSMAPEMLIEEFYGVSANNWLDENGQIKEQEFIAFLEAIKILSDENAESMVEEEEIYEIRHFSREYMAYSDTQLHIEPLRGFLFMTTPYSVVHQRGNGDFEVMKSGGKGVYEARGIVGINANSKNIDIAKGIVETALSEQVQNVNLGEGFAVNTESFNKQSDLASDSGTTMAMGMSPAGSRPIEFVDPGAEAYKKVADQGKAVSQPAHNDEVLLQMIIEETKGYFDGTKTAEEATGAVAQRTKAYLAE